MSFRLEPLADHHDLSQFECGNVALDDWLQRSARAATGHGTRTYVLVDAEEQVVGYVAIAPHTIQRDHLSAKTGRGAPRSIPAILLAKLALSADLHGQHLGSDLLIAALEMIVDAARRAGGKFVVIDAIDDEAARFYVHHDFEPMPDDPRRLTRKLSTVAKALGRPWP